MPDAQAVIDRVVWIVGDPEQQLPKTDPRYHTGDCYVLDQTPNRDRVKRVRLSGLSDAYGPCLICAPAGRKSGVAAPSKGRRAPRPPDSPRGAQLGSTVRIQDLDTGKLLTVRLVPPDQKRQPDEISTDGPLGKALLGGEIGSVAEFNVPRGGQRKALIVDFRQAND